MNDITIRVLDADEEPVAEVRVDVYVDGSMFEEGVGGDLDPCCTDDDGHAYFTTACDYPDHAEIQIRIDGVLVDTQRISGGSFSVHLP